MIAQVVMSGVDLFCPDCGRQLVWVNEDGSFALAEPASMLAKVTGDMHDEELDGLILAAKCLRWRCQAKRLLRSLKARLSR